MEVLKVCWKIAIAPSSGNSLKKLLSSNSCQVDLENDKGQSCEEVLGYYIVME